MDLTGKKVVLIGGGNVAMDAARTAVRLGAETIHVFTRKRDDMTALASEVESAMQEGVRNLLPSGWAALLEEAGALPVIFDGNTKLTPADVLAKLSAGTKAQAVIGELDGDLLDTIVRFIPDKVVTIKTEQEDGLTLARIESYRKEFMPYGIDLNYAMENNAGNAEEFMTRVKLFDEYADDNITRLNRSGYDEDYYLQIHAVKSIARGIGAHLLAQMTESVEIRHDDDFSKEINPIILDEYARVREGLRRLTEAVEKGHE